MSSFLEVNSIQVCATSVVVALRSAQVPIDVDEVGIRTIVIHAPPMRPVQDLLVLLQGQITIAGTRNRFEATGKLIAKPINEGADNARSRLEVELLQYDKALWEKFLAKQKAHQHRIDGIISAVRGDDDE